MRAVLFRYFHNPSNYDAYYRVFNVITGLLRELQNVLTAVKLGHLQILIMALLDELQFVLTAVKLGHLQIWIMVILGQLHLTLTALLGERAHSALM